MSVKSIFFVPPIKRLERRGTRKSKAPLPGGSAQHPAVFHRGGQAGRSYWLPLITIFSSRINDWKFIRK
jgi:hypothetical protein